MILKIIFEIYFPNYLNRIKLNIEDKMIMINDDTFKNVERINMVSIISNSIFVPNIEFLKFLKDKNVKFLNMCIDELHKNDIEKVSNLLWNLKKGESIKIVRLEFGIYRYFS